MIGLGMNPLGAMEASNDSFGVISNTEVELIDNVILLEDDCNYLNLIADCISEISQAEAEQEADQRALDKAKQAQDQSCSVEVISDTCKVHKYYSEKAATVVENHFTRSFAAETSLKMMETETNASVRKTGSSKRKAKRQPTVTSLLPSRAHVTTDARVHPYTLMHPPYWPYPPPSRVEVHGGDYYVTPLSQYCVQYQRYSIKNEDALKPPVYQAFWKGNTLIEIYSPAVGRGFNPRYNSVLIEPTVQAFLPPITGQNTTMSAIMADLHTFTHMALEFNIPT